MMNKAFEQAVHFSNRRNCICNSANLCGRELSVCLSVHYTSIVQ